MNAPLRSVRASVFVLVALWLGGCPTKMGPRFPNVSSRQLPGVSARSIAPSRDGARWLIHDAPNGVRIFQSLAHDPVVHEVGDRVIGAVWLEGDRVLVAAYELPSSGKGAKTHRVETLDAALRPIGVVKLPPQEPPLTPRAFTASASGRFVALDSAVYDLQNQAWALEHTNHAWLQALAFTGDDWLLTASFHDGRVLLRSLRDSEKHEWLAPKPVTTAVFDPATRIVFVGTRSDVYTWQIDTERVERARVGSARSVDLCDGGRTLAVLGERKLLLLDKATLKTRFSLKLQAPGTRLAVDERIVVVGDEGGSVYAIDAREGKLRASASVLGRSVDVLGVHAATHRVVAASRGNEGSSLVVLSLP